MSSTSVPLGSTPAAETSQEPVNIWRGCHNPDVATDGHGVIVTYTGHMQHIKYGWFDGTDWHLDHHLTTLHPRFVETLEHSPWCWKDAQGVIHVSFVCLTRSLAYDSKWLGDGFSDPQPVEGLYHPSLYNDEARVLAERMSLDPQGGTVLLSSSFLPERHGTYAQPVEPLTLAPGEALLMFDTDAIDEVLNGRLALETMTVDPDGPILEPTGSPDDFDGSRVLGGGTVLKDGNGYRMWYGAVGLVPEEDVPWYDQVYVGYAESPDGAHWERVDTGNDHMYPGRPAPHRFKNIDHNACVFIDPEDTPARRYKAIKFENRAIRYDRVAATGELGYLGLPRRAWLSTSPDGLTWDREEVSVDFPGMEPYGLQPQTAIHDPRDPDPERRYKVIGFSSLIGRRRGATLAWSPDTKHWTVAARSPLLDSMMAVSPVRPAGPYGQLHDASLARHGPYLLAFYQNQFDGKSADIRLAWSRNGERFRFAFPETPLVPLGPPGTWNSAYLMTSNFVADGDRMFCFFGANSDAPFETVYGMPILRMCAGRASAPLNRFARIGAREAGVPLSITTAPLALPVQEARHLEINARMAAESCLRVGLLNAAGKPVKGFGLADSLPSTGDSVRHPVRWQGGHAWPQDQGPLRVCLELRGNPEDAVYALAVSSGTSL